MFTHVKLEKSVPKLTQLNEDGTRYYVTPEGNKYPSVTTVLSAYNSKYIFEWRKRVGDEQANAISRRASTRGTKLHKACEDYLNNTPPKLQTPLEVELFTKFKPVLHQIDNIHAQEIRMYSDHLRMAGTVDCVAFFNGRLSIIDFKTASKQKDKDSIGNYFMQCSAYAIMFEERFEIPVSQIVVAIAVEDDDPQIFVEKRDNHVKELIRYRDLYESKFNLVSST
jgi:genome maintenance exonuclease 1